MNAIALLLFVGIGADAQRLYVGVTAGTPFSQSTSSAVVGTRAGSGLSTLNVRRYTLGPTAEIRVWRQVSVEVNALYKRLDRTEHRFFNPSVGNITRLTANAWEFPFLLNTQFVRIAIGHSFSPGASSGASIWQRQAMRSLQADLILRVPL